jgi:two-component system chemotaxis response regulator CheB
MEKKSKKIRLLIVDDSLVMQHILVQLFSQDPNIEIVGLAGDPYIARDLIKTTNPDVITLDIEMPKMDGITFLKNLMRLNPLPTVMLSSFTEKGSKITLEALALGAIDYMRKPTAEELTNSDLYARELINTVKNASLAKMSAIMPSFESQNHLQLKNINIAKATKHFDEYVIGIGASTGGIEAIERVLKQFPTNMPGIVVVQHIHYDFSLPFVERLNAHYRFIVSAAEDGLEIKPGHVVVAKGGQHLEIVKQDDKFICKLRKGDKVSGHMPSVDVLFESLAKNLGNKSVGILLTGMGQDGARGLKAIKDAGGNTIVQDEASSVIWGMPGYAVSIEAAKHVLHLDNIGKYVIEHLYSMGMKE